MPSCNLTKMIEDPEILFEQNLDENTCGESHCETVSQESFCCEDYNQQLKDRISQLRETIRTLKDELQEEREEWNRELNYQPKYAYFDDFQSANLLMQSHFDNRYLLQKQIAVANYKRRLLEVENLCNMELLKVKQSVQILQPLQAMASAWKAGERNGAVNGGTCLSSNASSVVNAIESEMIPSPRLDGDGERCEVSMPLELLAKNLEAGGGGDDVEKKTTAITVSEPVIDNTLHHELKMIEANQKHLSFLLLMKAYVRFKKEIDSKTA